jgi:signal transduction histidine kinase
MVDVIVATLLLAGELAALASLSRDDSPFVATASCVVLASSVALRRQLPSVAALAALGGLLAYQLATRDPDGAFPPVAVVLSFYMVGRSGTARRHPVRAVLLVVATLATTGIIEIGSTGSPTTAVFSALAVAVVPLVAGLAVGRQSQLSLQLAAVAEQLREEQDLKATRAMAEERNRIARDLHDVVAHSVSVMVVQAGAARLIADVSPSEADDALAVIGDCGRDALADLRRIVGVLRRNADQDFGCGAGLADLGRLAERIRLAGVPTQAVIDGDPRLPPAADLVAYRVVQEALTNVVKHAGPGATADVLVVVGAEQVTIRITNVTGPGKRDVVASSGLGLVGMRERVLAQGGDLQAGPRPDDGYLVEARLPVQASSRSAGDELSRFRGQGRSHSRLLAGRLGNAVFIVGWFVAMEAEAATSTARQGPWAVNAVTVAAMALAGIWRRRHPLVFLAVVGALAAVLSGGLTSLDSSTIAGLYTLAVPLFTVGAWQTWGTATVGLILWMGGASVVAVAQRAAIGGIAGALVMGLVVWTAGRLWRAQLTLSADLTETTTRLASERDQRARLAVATERTRIARDLHGLVAHGVVRMVVQAEAARDVLALQPESASEQIRGIEQAGREALTQLRRILGVLRSTEQAPHGNRTTFTAIVTPPEEVLT